MTKPTIEDMVEWLGALRCDCEPPRMFDIDPEEMADAIRDHLLASQANTLPLDEVPDGWLVDKLSQEDDGWFCCLVKPASPFSDEAYYAYSQEHGEVINISSPTEALRAAIAKVKS